MIIRGDNLSESGFPVVYELQAICQPVEQQEEYAQLWLIRLHTTLETLANTKSKEQMSEI